MEGISIGFDRARVPQRSTCYTSAYLRLRIYIYGYTAIIYSTLYISLNKRDRPLPPLKATMPASHMHLVVTPLSELRVSRYHIPAYRGFPNTSIHPERPLMVYHNCFTASSLSSTTMPPSSQIAQKETITTSSMATAVESHLSQIDAVRPAWKYTMYRQHHYHSNTNEILCVVSRRGAEVGFGGSNESNKSGNEGKVVVKVGRGDVIVVPAGVGHALLRELDDVEDGDEDQGKFEMVGSYPVGAEGWDMCMGDEKEKDGKEWENVRKVGWFSRDPIYGDQGPVLDAA
jgi:uncharacterized protein YjlB